MNNIVVVGSLNMDLVVQASRLPLGGETIMGTAFHEIPGGKGANQAVAMARLGASVKMIGKVGQDGFGSSLLSTLKVDGVDTIAIESVAGQSTGVALITLQDSGENSIIVVPGANGEVRPSDIDQNRKMIQEASLLVTQLEVPIETVSHALKTAKAGGAITILNPAPAQALSQEILSHVDLLTPNETELALISQMPVTDMASIKKAAQALIDQGVKALVVTLGSEGSLYLNDKGESLHQKAFEVKALDTTAAGDSFTAGLAVCMSQGKPMAEALEFASKVGALTVQTLGAQSSLPFLEAVESF